MATKTAVFNSADAADCLGAARVLQRCDKLASFSSQDEGICRIYLTPELAQCNAEVGRWMEDAGMTSWIDEVGNCWGHYPTAKADAPVLILGSHLDTVPNAGRFDGILGVLAAIEIVAQLHRHNIRLPFAIDVVGFADEEGSRFGATLLGSRAVAGTWEDRWFELCDAGGMSLREALIAFGLDPQKVRNADRSQDKIKAYFEVHIEQGPVLEEKRQALGLVTSIAGARRFLIQLGGMAGHAGTVPMSMRRDALLCAAKCIVHINEAAKAQGIVATVGKIDSFPSSINVIPGSCEFSIDARSGDDEQRDLALEKILSGISTICAQEAIKLEVKEIHSAAAVKCAPWIQALGEKILAADGDKVTALMSGAGHDAMAFNGVCDIGMLFVRCAGGISHNPAESVTREDVNEALNALYQIILNMPE